MKILYSAFDVVPAPKGASVRIQAMLSALSQLTQATQVQGMFLGEPGYAEQELWPLAAGADVQVQRLISPEPFLSRSVLFAEQVLAQTAAWQPEVVQFRSLWDAFPLVQYRQRYGLPHKLVYELHGLPEYELEHHFPELPAALLAKIQHQQRTVLLAADAVLCPSPVHEAFLGEQGVPAHKIQRVQNGVDLQLFQPSVGQLQPAGEKLRLLYIGTLAPWQGLEGLLEALQPLDQPFVLQLVGKGQRRWQQDLLTRAFQLRLSHALEMHDPLPHAQMPGLIQAADICLAPLDNSERNRVQGCMPFKILEYMACGKAIIAPDLPVIQHLLSHAETGWLYDSQDPVGLQQALQTLMADPALRQRLGQAARQAAEQRFGWQQMQQQLQGFYNQLLGSWAQDSL